MESILATRPLPAPRTARAAPAGSNATLVERRAVSPTVVRLRVRPDGPIPDFVPGQYLALGVEVDGRPLQRPYSTASARGESEALEFLVRLVDGGTLTPRLWRLHAGDRLHLGRPKGLFIADPAEDRRAVYVATGTGIAPLRSMLETRLTERPDGPAGSRPVVVHGVARAEDLAYRERLQGLADQGRITYMPAVSRPGDPANAGWAGFTGRVASLVPGILAQVDADPARTIAYVCGNPGMTEAATAALTGWGMPDEAVRSEAYWVAAAPS
jgi:CDP-4-dehydro-6-deoxyglucose reductase